LSLEFLRSTNINIPTFQHKIDSHFFFDHSWKKEKGRKEETEKRRKSETGTDSEIGFRKRQMVTGSEGWIPEKECEKKERKDLDFEKSKSI